MELKVSSRLAIGMRNRVKGVLKFGVVAHALSRENLDIGKCFLQGIS